MCIYADVIVARRLENETAIKFDKTNVFSALTSSHLKQRYNITLNYYYYIRDGDVRDNVLVVIRYNRDENDPGDTLYIYIYTYIYI